MTTFILKIIACLTMLIDHVGFQFFIGSHILRIIGRIAFPIFAFLIAEGYYHTHDVKKYFKRLFIFGIISQIPYTLVNTEYYWKADPNFIFTIEAYTKSYNIFVTLILGLLAIYLYEKNKKLGISYLVIICVIIKLLKLPVEYECYGILVIFFFYIYRNKFWKQSLCFSILTAINIFYYPAICIIIYNKQCPFYLYSQAWSLLALIFIFFYNGKKGKNLKYIFYIFYPLHLFIIFLIDYFTYYIC